MFCKSEDHAISMAQQLANVHGRAAYVTSRAKEFFVSLVPGTFNCLRVLPTV
jgi:hypothetical protein